MAARVTATCVTQAVHERTSLDDAPTGIDKASVRRLEVTGSGALGDQVLDLANHGGADKALYAYSDEDAEWWAAQLGEEVPPGRFGENLRVADLDLGAQVIGTRWRIGPDVVVEVSEPRVPCSTFQHHMGDRPGWVRDFTAANRTGTYLRVLRAGAIERSHLVEVIAQPDHGVTIAGWFGHQDPAHARRLLDAETDAWSLPVALRSRATFVLRNA